MSEQNLSQEEVDALLQGIADNATDAEPAAPAPAVAVPNPTSAREEGSGATAGGREAAARGGGRPLPGLGPRAGGLSRRALT